MKIIKKILIFFIFLNCFSLSTNASFLKSFKCGVFLYEKKDIRVAQKYFEDYVKNNPNDEYGYYWLAKTYLEDLKEKSYADKNFKKAYEIILKKRNIEKVILSSDLNDNLEDYFDMATTYFEAGNYNKADKYADLMLKIEPKSALAYFVKAKVAYTKGENEKAKELLEYSIMYNNEIIKTNLASMLEINKIPDLSKDACYYMAFENFFKGNLEQTKNYIEKYINLEGENIEMRNFFVDLALKTDDISKAQKTVDEVFKINSKNIQNYINQAKIYKALNETQKIETVLNKAYKINPNNKELLYELGNYYLDKKDYESSKKFFENLTAIDDKYYEAYFGYIYSLIQLKDFDNAVVYIRKASAINPDTSEISYLLSKICMLNAKYKEALSYLEEALKKEQNSIYYLELAKINQVLGKYNEAVKNLNDALLYKDCNVENTDEIYEYLAECYLKTNDLKSVRNIINDKNKLDKNKIIYKYILYKLCKLEGNEKEISLYFSQLKRAKPLTESDYVVLSEFYFEEFNLDYAIKFLKEGEKRFSNSIPLYSQKLKLYYLADNKEKIDEIIK